MIYTKFNFMNKEINLDIYEDQLFTVCASCATEFQVDFEVMKEVIKTGGEFSSTSLHCVECTRRGVNA